MENDVKKKKEKKNTMTSKQGNDQQWQIGRGYNTSEAKLESDVRLFQITLAAWFGFLNQSTTQGGT